MLRRSAARFPDKPAIIFRGPEGARRVLAYRELDALANQLAHALLALGLPKGTKVSMLSRNLPEYGVVFFGTARTGLVLNNVSILYAADELAWVLNKSDTEVLIIDAQFADKLAHVRQQCPRIQTVVLIGSQEAPETVRFNDFIARHPTTPPDVSLSEFDAFCMTYTGGTTGRPKGVLMHHRARDVTAHTVVVEERLTPEDVVGIVTPLFHVAALNIMFQPAVLIGATSVFVAPWSPDGFMDACEAEGITAAFMVPTQANTLVTHPRFAPARLGSWAKLSFAGAPMPDWVQLELIAKLPQLKLTQIYGQSEMGVIAALPAHLLPAKLGSVGRQPYNVDMAVLRPDGTPVAVGEIGEVATRGDNVMIGYYDEPEQTEAFFKLGHGWGLSGDVATMDADGCIILVDRAKDMLISGGENVYPKEIEDAIYGLPQVAEVAVFGVPDPKFGEVPAAYILLKPGAELTEAQVLAQCEAKLARLKRPRLIKFVESFPKTAIGKIQKNLLKEPYWEGRKRI
ncbi:class I adenylate-forming enzyme family protein [Ottowia thiooxydans]|uniref:class I adenylate-forming enzyme family protein n=1 Tax=Ottowia thiooxydans TaxID=219182 RepID=UPI001FE2123B|nr:AMP-binding protein [Ottowia thiooxydans]